MVFASFPRSFLKISYEAAKQIDNNNEVQFYLTEVEYFYFKEALKDRNTWQKFFAIEFEPKSLELQSEESLISKHFDVITTETEPDLISNSSKDTPNKEDFPRLDNNSYSIKCIAAFRTRAMLYEQLYSGNIQNFNCCSFPLIDLDEITPEPLSKTVATNGVFGENVATKKRRVIEEDYDDDYDEEEEESVIISSQVPSPATYNDDFSKKLEEIPCFQRKKDEEYPVNSVYYTVEFDQAAIAEQQLIEEKLKIEEETQSKDPEPIDAQPTQVAEKEKEEVKNPLLNINSGMKHLLTAISSKRNMTSLTDHEIKSLLTDVRPHRSKWASDEKVGQEELYECCEKIINELRNYTEHSLPFLNKVSKREAPDYFDIVKHPMDLGTMGKKLKTFQYKSKAEFTVDLNLIYANCLAYNTDPASIYRKHAYAMKKKTNLLLANVPDIVIRDKAEVDAEKAQNEELKKKDTEESQTKPEEQTPKVESENTNHTTSVSQSVATTERESSESIENASKDEETQPSETTHEKLKTIKVFEEPQLHTWRTLTRKLRAEKAEHQEVQRTRPFSEQQALLRTPQGMKHYESSLTSHDCVLVLSDGSAEESEEEDRFEFIAKTFKKRPKKKVKEVFVPEYHLQSGFPDVYQPILDIHEQNRLFEEDTNESKDAPNIALYPGCRFSKQGVSGMVDTNIEELKKIRIVHTKIMNAKMNMPIDPRASDAQKDEDFEIEEPPSPDGVGLPPLLISKEIGNTMLERASTKLLAHAGFEAAQPIALALLTDVVIEFFLNLGKTLRSYMDSYNHGMSAEEIILHSLYENGIRSVDALEGYVRDDVFRYNNRLNDLHRRLDASYQDILTQNTDGDPTLDEHIFDSEDAFASGGFGEELGEDFFGFKELGLDKEFNISTLSVPTKLWFGQKQNRNIPSQSTSAPTPDVPYPPPPSFPPIKSSDGVIGLLRIYYAKKLEENNGDFVEDEFLSPKMRNPFKPRYPPVTKVIGAGDKKPADISAANAKINKKKRLEYEAAMAERAEKKKQKAEAKAAKLAEKADKKKLREEEREKQKQSKK
ncbi:Transcriptional activator spt7 [Basidiobolus ranarum]|uniref:Transcriptional activator spt7 n=1 Tax=Basidiobolus ranarum TaxID=34480 RepID=A0ABR2W6P0_9FUNG